MLCAAFDLGYAFVKELQALPDAVRSKLTGIMCKFMNRICTIVSAKLDCNGRTAGASQDIDQHEIGL